MKIESVVFRLLSGNSARNGASLVVALLLAGQTPQVCAQSEMPKPIVARRVTLGEMSAFETAHSGDSRVTELIRGDLPPPQIVDVDQSTQRLPFQVNRPNEAQSFANTTEPRAALPLIRSFLAQTDNQTVYPPDTDGAVGPAHTVTLLNSGFAVRTKFGGFVVSQIHLASFWFAVGTAPGQPAYIPFDPRIQYDQYTGRWVAVACGNPNNVDGSGASWLLLAVSETSDPTMAWHQYAFEVFNPFHFGDWMDFPSLGLDQDNYIISGNIFQIGGPFVHADVYIFDKTPLLAGLPVGLGVDYSVHHDPCGVHGSSYQSCHTFGDFSPSPVPPYRNYLLSEGWTDNISMTHRYIRVSPIDGVGAAASIVCPLGIDLLEVPCYNFYLQTAFQPNACNDIDTGRTNLTSNAVLRLDEFGDPHVWLTHTVGRVTMNCPTNLPPPAKAEVAWYQFRPSFNTSPPGILEHAGRVSDPSLSYYYPSIAVDKNLCVLLGFSGSGTTRFGSAFYTTRQATDPVNFMEPVNQLKLGLDSYRKLDSGNRNRWGDYSTACVDPADDETLWTIQEYADQDLPQFGSCNEQSSRWSTWWGAVRCGGSLSCPCPGKINPLLNINGGQVGPFLTCLGGSPLPGEAGVGGNCNCADADFSGFVDVNDIAPFVDLLLSGPTCP